jgi:hypothetical protein
MPPQKAKEVIGHKELFFFVPFVAEKLWPADPEDPGFR